MAPRGKGRRRGHVLRRIILDDGNTFAVASVPAAPAVNRMQHSAFAYAIHRLAAKQRIRVFMDIRIYIFLFTSAAIGIAVNSQEIGNHPCHAPFVDQSGFLFVKCTQHAKWSQKLRRNLLSTVKRDE
jgi:hypothetical protein